MGIELIKYKTYDAVRLSNSRYSAVITYGRGCNMVELNDMRNHLALLHYPESHEADEYEKSCQRFGSAILFPPNKIRDGIFHWKNRTYDFKSNQLPPAHGIIKEFPFDIDSSHQSGNEDMIKFRFNSFDSVYHQAFGWHFTCFFTFILSLSHSVTVLVVDSAAKAVTPNPKHIAADKATATIFFKLIILLFPPELHYFV